jgi:hypothetical protein
VSPPRVSAGHSAVRQPRKAASRWSCLLQPRADQPNPWSPVSLKSGPRARLAFCPRRPPRRTDSASRVLTTLMARSTLGSRRQSQKWASQSLGTTLKPRRARTRRLSAGLTTPAEATAAASAAQCSPNTTSSEAHPKVNTRSGANRTLRADSANAEPREQPATYGQATNDHTNLVATS